MAIGKAENIPSKGECLIKIARITTIPEAFINIKDTLKEFSKDGLEIHLISSPGKYSEFLKEELSLKHYTIPIKRDIHPFQDFISLVRLFWHFRREKYDIVHSSTPKAGLLVALAGFLARTPIRLHTFTGQRWETLRGIKYWLTFLSDKLIGRLNTWNYSDSPSCLEFLQHKNILHPARSHCLGEGSHGGVNPNEFYFPNREQIRKKIRCEHSIDLDSFVIIFLGRITRDKGIKELVDSFKLLRQEGKKIDLLLVGPFEPNLDPLPPSVSLEIQQNPFIHWVGFQNRPAVFLAASDVLCLPSYRESFGISVIQAAACGLPSIGTQIRGLSDVIKDGKTGLLSKMKSIVDLKKKIATFYEDRELLKQYGRMAKKRTLEKFHYKIVAKAQIEEYKRLAG